jgi:hypothetical protein
MMQKDILNNGIEKVIKYLLAGSIHPFDTLKAVIATPPSCRTGWEGLP